MGNSQGGNANTEVAGSSEPIAKRLSSGLRKNSVARTALAKSTKEVPLKDNEEVSSSTKHKSVKSSKDRKSVNKSKSGEKDRKSVKSTKSVKKEKTKYKSGILVEEDFDKTVRPQDDFWRYVNGGWLDNNPVPPEYPRWGTFEMLNEHTMASLHKIVQRCAESPENKDEEKIGAFWKSAMDVKQIKSQKLKPLKSLLAEVDAVTDIASLSILAGRLCRMGINVLFDFDVQGDLKNSEQEIVYLDQGGLGMPDRDYYFDEDKKEKLSAFKKYVEQLFGVLYGKNAGEDDTRKASKTVLAIETTLAKASWRRKDRRDPTKLYHPETLETISALFAPFDLVAYFEALGITKKLAVPNKGPINNTIPDFLTNGLVKVLTKFSIDDLKTYVRFHILNAAAPYMHDDLDEAHFNFHSKVLNGQSEQKPRWKRILSVLQREVGRGEALGKIYCAENFKASAKELMISYVEELRLALGERINALEWMGPETKKKALEKLNAFGVKIGYPDKWEDVSSLKISPSDYWGNVVASRELAFKNYIKTVNGPPDKTQWEMPPQMINAYFHPNKNEIVFPAAILQPPFFSETYDPALCFGAIGGVIGHEMTHGFDDQGRKFDASGNMKDWWTAEDSKNFDKRAKVIVKQFDAYTVHGLHVQGSLTQGENIADLGGMKVAYYAMQNWFKKHGRQGSIDGFTPEQRFFISWTRGWRGNITEERAKMLVSIDPHSPGMYRVLGPLRNLPEFVEAFDVKEGDKMFAPVKDRVVIW